MRKSINFIDVHAGLKIVRVCDKNILFLFLNQNIFCEYSKVSLDSDSFEHKKHLLKLMDKKIFPILS